MDHNNRTTQFTDPRLNTQILSSILRRQTPTTAPSTPTTTTSTAPTTTPSAAAPAATPVTSTGNAAATNGATQAAPPRPRPAESDLPQGLLNDSELLPKYRRDLVGKLRALRAELTALQPQSGHCRLEVSRNEVFEESYRSVGVF